MDGAISIVLSFAFRRRDGNPAVVPPEEHTTRPDVDNLVKPVLDALRRARFFHDDCQVSRLVANKVFGDSDSISVDIRTLTHTTTN